MTPQNYYKTKKHRVKRSIDEQTIINAVKSIRQSHPMMGVRKLKNKTAKELIKKGISIGRDRLFELLRENGLLNKRKKRFKRLRTLGTALGFTLIYLRIEF